MVNPVRNGNPAERSEYFRQMQKKSRETYKGTGGFHSMKKTDPERFYEITSKGGKNRWPNEADPAKD